MKSKPDILALLSWYDIARDMFEGLIKQIGPGLPCAEFADDCIDYGFVFAAIVSIIGAIIGLAAYRRISRKNTAFGTK